MERINVKRFIINKKTRPLPALKTNEFVIFYFQILLAYIPNEKINARDANTDKGRINEISADIIIFNSNSFLSRTIELSERIEFNLGIDVLN